MATQAFCTPKPGHHGSRTRIGRTRLIRARAADDAFANYAPRNAFLFPGQGAQTVGMAKDICAESASAKALFDSASEVLGYDLLEVCTEGPKDKLNSTVVSQPAIYVASMAALAKLKEERPEVVESCDVAAGLSLGEYTALAFAGAMTFEDGLKLVKLRGESMQAAADAAESGMVSVIGLDSEKVKEICAAANERVGSDAIQIANYLCPGNYAVSGSMEACNVVAEIAKPEFKARMTVKLAVAGAFHTDYMAPAVDKLKEALGNTTMTAPRIPVISNVDAQPHSDPDTIKNILARQVTSPVLWENTLKTMLDKGLEQSYEIGPNKVIAGIMKRIDKAHKIENITA